MRCSAFRILNGSHGFIKHHYLNYLLNRLWFKLLLGLYHQIPTFQVPILFFFTLPCYFNAFLVFQHVICVHGFHGQNSPTPVCVFACCTPVLFIWYFQSTSSGHACGKQRMLVFRQGICMLSVRLGRVCPQIICVLSCWCSCKMGIANLCP